LAVASKARDLKEVAEVAILKEAGEETLMTAPEEVAPTEEAEVVDEVVTERNLKIPTNLTKNSKSTSQRESERISVSPNISLTSHIAMNLLDSELDAYKNKAAVEVKPAA
jgi:hypothetical protein